MLAIAVLALPRVAKRCLVLFVDLGLCVLAVWLAYYLRIGEFISFSDSSMYAVYASISIALPIFITFGFYRAIFRYSGWTAFVTVAYATGFYSLLYFAIFTAIGVPGVPRTVGIIQPILLLLLVGASRTLARMWLGDQYFRLLKQAARQNVLVYGAGKTGRQLVDAMENSNKMKIAGFLDDDERLQGNLLNGKPIYDPAVLPSLVSSLNVSGVLLAMPSISRKRRNEILTEMRTSHVAVRSIPSVTDLAQGKVSVSDLCELDIDDLLGREPVLPSPSLLSMKGHRYVVMVTGAGGSIGSELCRQIFAMGPSKLLMIDQNEFALYGIHQELEKKIIGQETVLMPLLASVQDIHRMREIMSTWQPDIVYHAAAYKHVPLVEHNPAQGIENNVFGTLRTAQAAVDNKVSEFVLISTDKAVRPTNIMGASKRLAEMTLQALSETFPCTKFSMVRFGNVLGSSGSVVPKFRQQIRDGGPITLTHPEITRYFMTIPEASQLVIQASVMADGGEVFVLNMGQPVKIMDLARRMVELSGLSVKDEQNPDGDIQIETTGLRPGEKLYEELLIGDNPIPTSHPMIMKAREQFIPWSDLEVKLNELEMVLNSNEPGVLREIMQNLIAGYTPNDEIVDWVYLEQGKNAKVSSAAS